MQYIYKTKKFASIFRFNKNISLRQYIYKTKDI